MGNERNEEKLAYLLLIEKFFETWNKSKLFRVTCALLCAVCSIVAVVIVLQLFPILPAVCTAITYFEDEICPNRKSDNTLRYFQEYKIEAIGPSNVFETYFPGLTAVTALTEDGKKVWTKFSRSASTNKKGETVFKDHNIYAIVEPQHLRKSSCILISPAKWPLVEDNRNDNSIGTGLKWKYPHIVLRTEYLKDDRGSEGPILLKLRTSPSDKGSTLWVNGKLNEGLRGGLSTSCSEFLHSANSRAQHFKLVNAAEAQSGNASQESENPEITGWSYVGIVYKNKWFERIFDVDVTNATEIEVNVSDDPVRVEKFLQYSYPRGSTIKALGNVNLRIDHIQYIDKKWINQKIVGLVCKDQVITIATLRRVAKIGSSGDDNSIYEFDGYWWAKVSGNIGPTCEDPVRSPEPD